VLIGGGLLAVPGVAGAWTFDQTLGVWRDQPTPAVTPSNEAKPRPVTKTPLPTPMVERTPTNVEIVNKALNPGASDPNVPLPPAMSLRRPAAVRGHMAAARMAARFWACESPFRPTATPRARPQDMVPGR